MHCDSQEPYKRLKEVKDGRVCVRKGKHKRRRIRHVDSFAAKTLLEQPCLYRNHHQAMYQESIRVQREDKYIGRPISAPSSSYTWTSG
jgi:hypothetical protein